MPFQTVEEKVIFEKLLRAGGAGGELPGAASAESLSDAELPSWLPPDHARALISMRNDGRATMRRLQYNAADRPELSSKTGLMGKAQAFVHRAARKGFLRWYVRPIAAQQTEYNMAAVRAADALSALQTQLIRGVADMQARQAEQARQLDALSGQLTRCRRALSVMAQRHPEEAEQLRALLEEQAE